MSLYLTRSLNIVREDMFNIKHQFGGFFELTSQEDSVPVSLLAVVVIVLNGSNIKAQLDISTLL